MESGLDRHTGTEEAPPQPTPAPDPQSLLAEALLAHVEHRYDRAEMFYRQVLGQDPGLIAAQVRYAMLLVSLGRPDEAEARLAQAIDIDPELTQSRLEAARRQDPHDDTIQSLQGLFSLHRGSPLRAYSHLDAALQANPDNVAAQAWMSRVLVAKEQGSRAGSPGIEANPATDAPAAESRPERDSGLPAEEKDRPACRVTVAAVGTPPGDGAVDELGLVGAQPPLPETPEAVDVPASFKASPDMERFREHLLAADRREAVGDYGAAIRELMAAASLLPDDDQVRERIREVEDKRHVVELVAGRQAEAQQRARDQDFPGALQLLEVALQLDPENAGLHSDHRRLLKQSEAFDLAAQARSLVRSEPLMALQLVVRAHDLAPELEDVTALQEEIERRLAVEEEVQAAIEHARDQRASGELAGARLTLSNALQVYAGEEQLKEAMVELDEAVSAQVEQWLGDGHRARDAGELDTALDLIEKAADLSPGHEGAQQALALILQELQAAATAQEQWRDAQARHAAGDLGAAITALKQAVFLMPHDQEMQGALQIWEREQEQERQRQRKVEEERRRQLALEEQHRQEAEARQQQELEEQHQKEAEAKRRQELEEQSRKEAEARRRQELEEQSRKEAEARHRQELEEMRRREAEARQQQELEEQSRQETEAGQREQSPPDREQTIPSDPDAAVRYHAARALADWRLEDTTSSSGALRAAFRLEGQATDSRRIALQCGLVWAGLSWTALTAPSPADRKAIRTVVGYIEGHDQPLRSDFLSHLLAHLARAAVDGERYHLENLALPGNTPDPKDCKIVQMVIRYRHLDAETRQQLDGMLVDRARGEMGDMVLHVIRQLLRRRA